MISARRTLLIAEALLFYVASIAIAQTPSEHPIEIPFRLVENVVWLQVRVNNSRPLNFMLDTAGNDAIDNGPSAARWLSRDRLIRVNCARIRS
jgi:hypothetical protein